jgi:hypothetical protein
MNNPNEKWGIPETGIFKLIFRGKIFPTYKSYLKKL